MSTERSEAERAWPVRSNDWLSGAPPKLAAPKETVVLIMIADPEPHTDLVFLNRESPVLAVDSRSPEPTHALEVK